MPAKLEQCSNLAD